MVKLTDTSHNQTRILVADDNDASATTLAWAMEANGHEVRTCNNGLEAVEMAKVFNPDVVLLDLGMPIMNGLEACKRMRQELDMESTLIIAQTAWGDPQARAETQAAGFNYHIVKPVDLDQVVELIAATHDA